MKKLETCRTCGKEFESEHGRKYCSEECRKTAQKEQWRRGNARRYAGISGQTEKRICAVCGEEFDGNGVQKYCSTECYEKATGERRKEYFPRWYQENKESVCDRNSKRKKTQHNNSQ